MTRVALENAPYEKVLTLSSRLGFNSTSSSIFFIDDHQSVESNILVQYLLHQLATVFILDFIYLFHFFIYFFLCFPFLDFCMINKKKQ